MFGSVSFTSFIHDRLRGGYPDLVATLKDEPTGGGGFLLFLSPSPNQPPQA